MFVSFLGQHERLLTFSFSHLRKLPTCTHPDPAHDWKGFTRELFRRSKDPFVCTTCSVSFHTLANLHGHNKREHPPPPKSKKSPTKGRPTVKKPKKEKIEKKEKKPPAPALKIWPCGVPGCDFVCRAVRKTALEEHIQETHNGLAFWCRWPDCLHGFHKLSEMRKHARQEHEESYRFITGEDKLPDFLLGGGASGHPGVYRSKGGWCASVSVPMTTPADADKIYKVKKRKVSLGTCFDSSEEAAEAVRTAKAQIKAGTFSQDQMKDCSACGRHFGSHQGLLNHRRSCSSAQGWSGLTESCPQESTEC